MTIRYIASAPFDMTIDGHLWLIPDGYQLKPGSKPVHCRSCQAAVLFATSEKTGKASPFDAVPNIHEPTPSVSHFATCPQAARWRK